MALEQTTTEVLFQGTDVPTHRALGYRQFLAGAGERGVPGGSLEGAQGIQRGQATGHWGITYFMTFTHAWHLVFPFVEPCQSHRE